jgi:ethanolamine ammonia-lyase small subunit
MRHHLTDETISSISPVSRHSEQAPPLTLAQPPAWLRGRTSARVALRRTGISLATSEVLDFQLAHARARDAVHAPLQSAALLPTLQPILPPGAPVPILLHSQARDRQSYLQRPDLGRSLDDASRKLLADHFSHANSSYDLAVILADGLSALAVERHAAPLLAQLVPMLGNLALAPICIVQQARVAIGDPIAHAIGARLAIVLIGERPGLSSPDSLGAYITWNPQPGITTDAARNCISNIRAEGLSYEQASARLFYYIQEAQSRQTTGIALKDPDASQLAQLTAGAPPQEPAGEPA